MESRYKILFLEQLETRTSYVEFMGSDVDALGALAVTVAESIAPGSKNVRKIKDTYLFYFYLRKKNIVVVGLGADAGDPHVLSEGRDVPTVGTGLGSSSVWRGCRHVGGFLQGTALCGVSGLLLDELDVILRGKKQQNNDQACVAAGVNDIELQVDHKYPYIASDSEKTPMSAILYGLVGTEKFHAFHSKLVKQAQNNKIQYMVRHYPRDSPLDTLLQGYGVALDIKNMEYKTIDDSKKTVLRHLGQESRWRAGTRTKGWHLKDLGASAVRAIVDAKNPLKRLETLSQDFPVQAKKLAFSRKSISTELREEISATRMQAANRRLKNKFIMNGIAVDPTERSFNVFDFMKTLKEEWSVAKQLGGLSLNQSELEDMLKHVRETNQEQPVVRIHVRGSMGGSTPLYLNNIETDPNAASWSSDVNTLRRPAWNLIFVRKNMYECVLVMDPLTGAGRAALSHIGFMRMRGAPVQWALLISSKELMASKTSDERQAVVEKYKAFKGTDKASPWHFAKLLMLAQSKDTAEAAANDDENKKSQSGDEETTEAEEEEDRIIPTRIASGFCRGSVKKEALMFWLNACDHFDNEILAMTEFIHLKHLPLDSFVFNGVVQKDLDIQRSMMANFGRDQPLFVNMAHRGMLNDDMDLTGDMEVKSPSHLVADDVDGRLEAAARLAISYLHAPGSRTLPKKQTVILPVDLNDPRNAGHAYRVVKALAAAIIAAIGHSDSEVHLKFVLEVLNCIVKQKSVNAMKDKLRGIWKKSAKSESDKDPIYEKVLKLLNSKTGKWLTTKRRSVLTQFNTLLRSRFPPAYAEESEEDSSKIALPHLFINGRQVTLPPQSLSDEDVATIVNFDLKYRTQPVAKALIKRSATLKAKDADKLSFAIMKTTGIVDKYVKTDRTPHMNVDENSLNTVRLPGDPSLQVAAYVDPLSEAAQVMSSMLRMLHSQLNATIELVLVPADEYTEFPLQRFYRYLFDKKSSLAATSVEFLDPDSPAAVKSTTSAVFQLESLLVYGQCRDTTFNMYSPPNGLQLVLDREVGAQLLHRDTLVMKNLGYFQLQATPGVWSLHLARGRAAELFDIIDPDTEIPLETHPITVYDFGSHISQFSSLILELNAHVMGKHDKLDKTQDAVVETDSAETDSALVQQKERTGETIHVFSVASGYLYERFVKIMMSSVLKRTNNPVTFWLLENFLSPDFKKSIPVLREQFGMDIRLVTYKWPNWLRQQTEKQRIIWGYKILFLDVLFPLGVQKIIYVDADQVVRADLKELWELDLEGKPYGYTPFCDSRNVGFQFWRQGYWKDHLRESLYSQLSADPNSLANLDQDLPNYAQHQIPIFSLPQEWLWCESWCSDETKVAAKTIDLCNNPKHKEPKLEMAKRVIAGELFNESWIELDQEIKDAEANYVAQAE
ncbi:Nucleotide-diphospho-sugar transferase [Phytophthora cactorum]|nr:Nucleotide-diphospho-sugar transferase [Phytophthora cactorum]